MSRKSSFKTLGVPVLSRTGQFWEIVIRKNDLIPSLLVVTAFSITNKSYFSSSVYWVGKTSLVRIFCSNFLFERFVLKICLNDLLESIVYCFAYFFVIFCVTLLFKSFVWFYDYLSNSLISLILKFFTCM